MAFSPYSITFWQVILGKSLGISASSKSGAASLVGNQNEEICLCLLTWKDTQPQGGKLKLGLSRLRGERRAFQALGHGVLRRLAGLRGGEKCLDGNV